MRPERLGVLTRRHTAGKLPPGDSGQNPRLQQRMSRSVVARVLSAPEALGSMPSTSLTNKQKKPNLITLPDPTKKTPSNGLKKKKVYKRIRWDRLHVKTSRTGQVSSPRTEQESTGQQEN